ncbi:MAG TPA: N-acetylmuramoyl-L-alanine amidase [Novosphingobium sp.]|nr:N-acetylmuramoyl-L-alanine amidase [Novosphingobium sp.]
MPRSLQLLLIALAPVAVFALMIWTDRTYGTAGRGRDYIVRLDLPPAGGEIGLPQIQGPLDASRPLVVIDAGHGGYDPGAGAGPIKEKDLTLRLALALRDVLLEQGGIRVALTRDNDSFLVLGERAGIARRLQADLFLSIHADSTEGAEASGATIYTLSGRGTSEVAERLAQRENRADSINGVQVRGQSDAVSAILVDLSQRETQAKSEQFARLLLREGAGRLSFHDKAVQSAAFAVLKSPDLPSVLLESGYINNPDDLGRLASPEGRAIFAEATARAIRVYFARRTSI